MPSGADNVRFITKNNVLSSFNGFSLLMYKLFNKLNKTFKLHFLMPFLIGKLGSIFGNLSCTNIIFLLFCSCVNIPGFQHKSNFGKTKDIRYSDCQCMGCLSSIVGGIL